MLRQRIAVKKLRIRFSVCIYYYILLTAIRKLPNSGMGVKGSVILPTCMDAPKTLQEAIQFFSDFENCRQFMVAVRWPDGKVRCPYCESEKVTYLEKARLYRCYGKHPKQKFSLKIGTVYEDSPIPLEKWLPATWLLSNCRNGISSYE